MGLRVQPIRRNWSGLLPVPGDGRYEWDGYLPITALPHEVNGFIATVNHYLFPNDYPWKEALHYTWADPYRAARISEVLGSRRMFSVAENIRLQNDDLSLPARALLPVLEDVSLPSGAAVQARERLRDWDYVLDKDSVAAGIYAMWQRRLFANTRDLVLPPSLRSIGASLGVQLEHIVVQRTARRSSRASIDRTRGAGLIAAIRQPRAAPYPFGQSCP